MTMTSSDSTYATHRVSAEDTAEYRARIAKLQTLMHDRGLDAMVVGDTPYGIEAGFRAAAYLSGFGLKWPMYASVVVVPSEGEPSLIIAPGQGHGGGMIAKTRPRTWIANIVATRITDPVEQARTHYGLVGPSYAADVVNTLRRSGADRGRIGWVGSWTGFDDMLRSCPHATFERADDLLRSMTLLITTPWELKQMEYTQRGAEAAMQAFIDAAQPGVSYRDAVIQMKSKLMEWNVDAYPMLTVMTGPNDPWWAFDDGYGLESDVFHEGDMVACELPAIHRGWHAQFLRTWVVGGRPNKDQTRMLDTAKRLLDLMVETCVPGVSGREMFAIIANACEQHDVEPMARQGHWIGYWAATAWASAADTVAMNEGGSYDFQDTTLQFMPTNTLEVEEGMPLVMHPILLDKRTEYMVMYGQTGVMTNGRVEFLNEPLSIDG